MGFFDIFKKKKVKEEGLEYASSLNGYAPVYSPFGTDIQASDVVQQAINCIVREMKKLDPQHVVEKGSDVVPQYDKIQRVLENPNPLMTTTDFLEKITWYVILTYNAFVIPVWDSNDRLEGLYPVYPHTVEFQQDRYGAYYVKMWFLNGREAVIPYDDVIHIRHNYATNEFMGGDEQGHPNHDTLLKTLELNNSMLEGIRKAMETSFVINGIIRYNTMLDKGKVEESMKEFTDALKRNEAGLMGMDLKAEYIPLNRDIKMVDAETLKFIDEKILRTFGVPLCILTGDYSVDQYASFYQKTIEPFIKSYAQAFTKAIFSRKASSASGFGHRIKFYPKDLIFLNTQQKLEMIRLLGDSGGLFENEKRVLMGLKPLPELQGVRKQSLNYVDVEIANEYQIGAKKEEEQPKEEESEEDESEADKEQEENQNDQEVQSE